MRSSRVILLVEPDDGIRVTFQVVLRREGFVVLEATNAAQALEQTREGQPDLVIIGAGVARSSSLELVRTLRAEAGSGPRILSLGREDGAEAEFADAEAVRNDHATPEQLVRVVTTMIGRA